MVESHGQPTSPGDSGKRSAPLKAVTAAQLAETLGLSRSTVSIVLRGDAERRKISAATVARVLEAARKYHYVPNFLAQSLRRQRSGIIGVIVVDFMLDWCEALMGGMYAALEPHRYTPFVSSHGNRPARLERELESCLRRRDDAVILWPIPGLETLYVRMTGAGMRLIFLGDVPPSMTQSHFVAWDAGPAARVAVEHLVRIGRRRIACVGVESALRFQIARRVGYEQALADAGLPVDPALIVQSPTPFADPDSATRHLEATFARLFGRRGPRPDALFMTSDALALRALQVLEAMKLRVPDDVAVASLGDVAVSRHPCFGLTTVREPVAELGVVAAETAIALVDRPAGSADEPIRRTLGSTALEVRRTTATGPGAT